MAFLVAATTAKANVVITFDENGNSTGLGDISAVLAYDWDLTPITNYTLAYVMPVNFQVEAGWVVIQDQNGYVSDLIHFSERYLTVGVNGSGQFIWAQCHPVNLRGF
jgi:hypothetical protein